jgi:hypothetical protein
MNHASNVSRHHRKGWATPLVRRIRRSPLWAVYSEECCQRLRARGCSRADPLSVVRFIIRRRIFEAKRFSCPQYVDCGIDLGQQCELWRSAKHAMLRSGPLHRDSRAESHRILAKTRTRPLVTRSNSGNRPENERPHVGLGYCGDAQIMRPSATHQCRSIHAPLDSFWTFVLFLFHPNNLANGANDQAARSPPHRSAERSRTPASGAANLPRRDWRCAEAYPYRQRSIRRRSCAEVGNRCRRENFDR